MIWLDDIHIHLRVFTKNYFYVTHSPLYTQTQEILLKKNEHSWDIELTIQFLLRILSANAFQMLRKRNSSIPNRHCQIDLGVMKNFH